MRFLNLKNHSILIKLSILIVVSIIPLLLMLSFVVLPEVEEQWYQNKYAATKTTVEAVFNTLEHFNKKVDGINYTIDDAKSDAAATIKSQRYEGKNYFWINDTDHKIVAHPLRPEREGKDASNLKDADGKQVYVEFVKACKNSAGEGFVRYNQLKPGIEKPQPKLSFVKLYKPWGWIIGSGVYLNDVEENVNELKSSVYQAIGLAVIMAFIIGFMIARFISVPILKLSEAAEKVSNGDLSARVDLDGDNELGKLGRNFNKMTQNIQENISTIEKKEIEANRKAMEAEEAKKISETQKAHLSESVGIMLVEMDKFSNGDLTVKLPVKGDDEIGKLFSGFNMAVRKINEIMTKVTELSSATMSSVNVINTRTEEIATGSHEQSSQITDVASAVEEMTVNIHSTTDHSSIATEKAKSAGDIAKKGGEVVADTVKGMVSISKIVDSAALKINTLGENSKQIGEIIQVIDEIADQTNLLALNAAIEAARAGEQGRGFAVVADEVRKLAERTTTATKEISEMIKKIQSDTLDAVNSINSGTKEVESGKSLAYQAGQSLEQIIKGSEDVVDVIAQVAMATEEQGSAAAIISQNLVGISTATEETTQNIHEIADSVDRLNSLTNSLNDLINEFKLNISHNENVSAKMKEMTLNYS